jgi:hypothetical protein
MSSSKKIDMVFAAGVYLPEAQNLPPYTLYTCLHAVYVFTQGRGGGELNQREG